MAEIKFSQLTTAAQLTNDDIFALAQMQGGSLSSVKTSMIAVANYLNTQVQYTTAYNTQAKTTSGAINELKQLISLIPQFSIEVVEELPTEDISDTTIYLVPAEDPEVGNYYEEYIHVNDAWELVGTTAVDLSAYYTKLEVDGLLATKASVTEVALKENKTDMPTDVRTIIKDCKTPKNATITNGIAQFECIEENLVKGLKVTMNPIQDLHGYSNPWAGGAGKNEYPLNSAPLTTTELTITPQTNGKFRIQANTTAQRSIAISSPTENLTLLPIGNHTISVDSQLPNGISLQFSGNNNNGMSYGIIQNTTTYVTREVTDATKGFYYLSFVVSADVTADFEVGLQIEKGNSATSFAPYSNICPISGRTEASVTRTGKNVFDLAKYLTDNSITYTKDGDWFIFSIGAALYANKFTLPELAYYSGQLIIDSSRTVATNVNLRTYKNGSAVTQGQTFTNQQIDQVGFNYSTTGQVCCKVQTEYGASNTAYEPYTAETHTHQYSETIYGGVDDFVNGGATSIMAMVDLRDLTWRKHSSNNFFYASLPLAKYATGGSYIANAICEQYKVVSPSEVNNIDSSFAIGTYYLPNVTLYIRDTRYSESTELEFTTAMSGVQLCYELATPTTISTSAEEITTVAGTNIISGTEPISECKYTELATVDDLRKIIGGQ